MAPRGRPRGGPPRVPGGPPGGQDRGCDPNHRLRHPPRWCGSGATPRNAPDCRSVIPFWGCTCRTWGKSPRRPQIDQKRNDGATSSRISLRRFTPTPPGGMTQPVVGVAPAVFAPPRAPPGPAVDPPRGRPGRATSVSCTSFYHSLALWPILWPTSP